MRVLITGHEGFTGKYVSQAFKKCGYDVVGLTLLKAGPGEVSCDLTNKAETRRVIDDVRPDGVIHLAAISFVGEKDPTAFYNVNVIGTLNLIEAIDSRGIQPQKIVIASSANIYGNPAVELVTEDTPPAPVNHYANSKLAMEFMVRNWFDRLPILLTRPFNYTGPGQADHFLVPKIVKHYRKAAKEIELGNLEVWRDFSDVRDVAEAYLRLFESEARSEAVNLSSGQVYSIKDIIAMMNHLAGYEIMVNVNPEFVRSNEIRVLKGDNSKLKKLTGYAPAIQFEKTLRDMLSSIS
jgi:GDP-6-deoxy-D-talose 4-dehydrogenase